MSVFRLLNPSRPTKTITDAGSPHHSQRCDEPHCAHMKEGLERYKKPQTRSRDFGTHLAPRHRTQKVLLHPDS